MRIVADLQLHWLSRRRVPEASTRRLCHCFDLAPLSLEQLECQLVNVQDRRLDVLVIHQLLMRGENLDDLVSQVSNVVWCGIEGDEDGIWEGGVVVVGVDCSNELLCG